MRCPRWRPTAAFTDSFNDCDYGTTSHIQNHETRDHAEGRGGAVLPHGVLPMSGPTRTETQREADRVRVASLYCQGLSHAAIAAEIGVTRQQITHDLKLIRQDWLDSSIRDFDEAKATELAKIDHLESIAWDAWFRSGGSHTILTEKAVAVRPAEWSPAKGAKARGRAADIELDDEDDPRGPADGVLGFNVETTEKTEELVGDERFLGRVAWCIDRRCKLFGVDAPTKIAPTDPTGEAEYQGDLMGKVLSALDRIASTKRPAAPKAKRPR